ncbi:MAG: VanZ family protein [Nitrospirae bacterium]|nr:VanZ family protein [Nitrospirota bacterium]
MKRFISLWGPVVFFAVLVFVMSSISSPIDEAPFPFFDKIAHITEYTVFAMLLFRALQGTWSGINFFWLAFITVVITLTYGASDEFHQSFVETRTSDIKDWAADGIGALTAMTAIFIKRRVFRESPD